MALPTLDATFASAADLPRRQMLAKWLVNLQYSGTVADYWTLPEHYLWAKIAVAAGAPRSEADYISLPKNYVWSDLYNAVSGSSGQTIDRGEKEAIGWIAAAVRGDAADPAKVATYISWPWRYQVASIITSLAVDTDAQSFITASGATDVESIDKFVKGVKNLGLWDSMVSWPLRSAQNAGTGTTAYSLGGLGTYNGKLVNGPTWGTSGLTNSVNGAVVALVPFVTTHSGLVVYSQSSTSGLQSPIVFGQATLSLPTDRRTNFRTDNNWFGFNGTTYINHAFGPSSLNAFKMAGYGIVSASTLLGYNDGATTTVSNSTANISGGSPANVLGLMSIVTAPSTSTGQALVGTMAFGSAFNVQLTSSQNSAFYNLYKQTLGTGLGLP